MRVARLLHGDAEQHQRHEDHGHGREDRPALTFVADHDAEGVARGRRNDHQGQDLQHIGQRRRVFERVRRIGVEEAAPIGAEHLDRFLRRDGADGDRLVQALQRMGGDVGGEGLHHTRQAQRDGENQRQRQQDVKIGADHIDPEIADAVGGLARQAANERHHHRQAFGRGEEVLHRQTDHLAEVAHGRFTGIGLPVGVGNKAGRRIERQVWRQARELLRIERQQVLEVQDEEQQDEADQRENDDRDGVGHPAHFLVGICADRRIDRLFKPAQDRRQDMALPLEHLGHVAAQRNDAGDQDGHIEGNLQPGVTRNDRSHFKPL